MEAVGEWIPSNAPPDEGYWQALLSSGEHSAVASTIEQAGPWEGRGATQGSEGETQQDGITAAQEMPVQGNAVIDADSEQGGAIPSEQITSLDGDQGDIFDAISPGDVREGEVTNLCSFGAFVDLGGVEGLIHVSEFSWGRVDHPSDALKPGESIEVYVINVDRDRERIGLSLKRLQPDPWLSVEERYTAGQIVEGTVTHVVDFGAFVRVEDGLEGLIHVSELSQGGVTHPQDVVQKGDLVKVLIINVDGERKRMGLSLRQVEAAG